MVIDLENPRGWPRSATSRVPCYQSGPTYGDEVGSPPRRVTYLHLTNAAFEAALHLFALAAMPGPRFSNEQCVALVDFGTTLQRCQEGQAPGTQFATP